MECPCQLRVRSNEKSFLKSYNGSVFEYCLNTFYSHSHSKVYRNIIFNRDIFKLEEQAADANVLTEDCIDARAVEPGGLLGSAEPQNANTGQGLNIWAGKPMSMLSHIAWVLIMYLNPTPAELKQLFAQLRATMSLHWFM